MHKCLQKFSDVAIQNEFNIYLSNNFELIFKGYTMLYIFLYGIYALDNLLIGIQFNNPIVGFIRLGQFISIILFYFLTRNKKVACLKHYFILLLEIINLSIMVEKLRQETRTDNINLVYLFHGISICTQYIIAILFLDYQTLRLVYLCFAVSYTKLRINFIPFSYCFYFVFIALLTFTAFYLYRRQEMRQFQKFTQNQNELKGIKQIIKENFPEGILIFSANSSDSTMIENQMKKLNFHFANNQFKNFILQNQLIKSQINIDQIENKSLVKSLQTINLTLVSLEGKNNYFKKNLTNINFYQLIFQMIECESTAMIQIKNEFNSNIDNNNNEVLCSNLEFNNLHYKVKFADCYWDKKPSKILILEDYTQKVKFDQIQILNHYKDKILATVTHDLKAPINGIIAQIESVESKDKLRDQQLINKIFSIIKVNMQLLLYMVYDIQDYSQIQKQKLKIIPKEFNIRKTIEQCVELIRIQCKIKNLEVYADFQLPEELEMVYNDEIRYKQIILNLLSNALKCTFKGFIKLEVKQGCIQNSIQTTVQDTGIGIEKQNIEKLFQFYYTGQEESTQHGVGLGLAIARSLVNQIGPKNSINVESLVGEGSKFTFLIYQNINFCHQKSSQIIIDIPVINIKDSSNFIVQDIKENNQINSIYQFNQINNEDILLENKVSCLNILVVDDDAFCLLAFKALCQLDRNINLQVAYNGQEALLKLLQEKFDAVFTDYYMPIMNGYEILLQIKKQLPNQIVYILSGNDEDKIKEQITKAGAKQVITKPINKEKFLEIINDLKTQLKFRL